MRTILALLALATALIGSGVAYAQVSSCGIPPIKPIVPIGCRDLVPVCQCDASGRCYWTWQCVR